jgi:hypothetical protein
MADRIELGVGAEHDGSQKTGLIQLAPVKHLVGLTSAESFGANVSSTIRRFSISLRHRLLPVLRTTG